MLYWAILFFIIAAIAAGFGFGLFVTVAASVAQMVFVLFLILFIAALAFEVRRRYFSGRTK